LPHYIHELRLRRVNFHELLSLNFLSETVKIFQKVAYDRRRKTGTVGLGDISTEGL